MIHKTMLALAAVAALGTAVLTPTTASATYGYGWYGKPNSYGWGYRYRPYFKGFYGPRNFYGGWKYGSGKGFYGYY